MIRHIVWWTLRPEVEGRTAAENAARIRDMGMSLLGRIDSLKSIEISSDIQSTTTQTAHLVLVSTHDDVEGLTAYVEHPEHQSLVALIKAATDSRQAIDYAV